MKIVVSVFIFFISFVSSQVRQIDKSLIELKKEKNAIESYKKNQNLLKNDDLYDSLLLPLSDELLKISFQNKYNILNSYLSRVTVFNKLNMYDSASVILHKLINLARKEKNDTIILKSYIQSYKIFLNNNSYPDYMDSINYYVSKINDSSLFADMLLLQCSNRYYNGETSTIIPTFKLVIDIYSSYNETKKKLKAMAFLALVYQRMGEYEKAKEIYTILLQEDINLSEFEKSRIELEFAGLLMKFNQVKEAKEIALSSLERMKMIKNNYGIFSTYIFLSYISGIIDDQNAVIYYSKQSFPYVKKTNNYFLLATVYNNIGSAFNAKNNYDSSLYYYHKLREIMNKVNDPSLTMGYYLNMASLSIKKDLKSIAKQYFDSAYRKINSGENATLLLDYYPDLIEYYRNYKEWENVAIYQKKYFHMNDSIKKIETQAKINELKVKYETEKKEKEILILKNERKEEKIIKQKIIYSWFATIIILFVFIIVFMLFRKNAIQKRKLNEEKLKRKEQEKTISEQKLEYRNNILKITNNAYIQQSITMDKVIKTIKNLKPFVNNEGLELIMNSLTEISNFSIENNWTTFEKNFITVNPGFMSRLTTKFPNLTTNEKRLCAFTKMKFSTPEICKITMQSKHSIYSLRFRLREKIGVKNNDELMRYIENF